MTGAADEGAGARTPRLLALARHPVLLLLVANGASAGLGLVSLSLLLRFLEVRDFAVVGVILGIGTLVSMAVDLRLMDLVARRFFERQAAAPGMAIHVARAGAIICIGQGLAVLVLAVLVFAATRRLFLASEVPLWWVWSAAAFSGAQLTLAGLTGLVRFCGAFNWAAWLRVQGQIASTLALGAMLWLTGGLDGYFQALLLGTVASLAGGGAVAAHVVAGRLGDTVLGRPAPGELASIVTGVRDIGAGGLFSAGWMLTRAGDILAVAAFSTELVTGTYRIARQVADAVTGVLDAVPHYFEPAIIAALKRGDENEARRHRRRIVAIGLAVGVVAQAVLVPLLSIAATHVFPKLGGAVVPIALLLVGTALRIGIQPWLWASAVARHAMVSFASWLLAGSIAQLVAIAVLAGLGRLTAETAAAASWVALVVLFVPYAVRGRGASRGGMGDLS